MATELFKRYRPKSLKYVEGNKGTITSLRNMLKNDTLPHTILFHGPSGCGKTTLARILANEMGCKDMDLVEMNCSSFRGIDTIREIMRSMNLAPSGSCRIWILDEVHQLSRDAQNASLKMLEDTPNHVYFFLCTTEPQKLLTTIRNRCSPQPVVSLSHSQLLDVIARVVRRARLDVSLDVAVEIADSVEGSARQALVILDKVRNLPESERIAAVAIALEAPQEVLDLCRVLFNRKGVNWRSIGKLLKELNAEPESVRWAVMGYARAILLKGKNERAYSVICAFEQNFYDSKHAGLARACYEVAFGD